jgi:hypothetical protein
MKPYRRLVLTTLIALGGLSITTARAAAPRLPASLYPPGSHISYRPSLSNHQMDCLWGFFCEGHVPLFHSVPESLLNRQTGWGEFAGVRTHNHMSMAFELFASRYASGTNEDGRSWAAAARDDLTAALKGHGYRSLHSSPPLVHGQVPGGWTAVIERSEEKDLIVMAGWIERTEVEAIAMVDHASPGARTTATTLLRRQVARALGIG